MTYKGNGRECHCAAHSENECACGADWTPDEVYELRARVEKLEAENAKLRTIPLRYRRMEFNAQLQQEAETLHARIKELEVEKDMWQGRFYVIEAENIALLAKEKQRLAVKQRLVRADK